MFDSRRDSRIKECPSSMIDSRVKVYSNKHTHLGANFSVARLWEHTWNFPKHSLRHYAYISEVRNFLLYNVLYKMALCRQM